MTNSNLTLPEAEAVYDGDCQRLSTLMLEMDAHSIAFTHYRRIAKDKPVSGESHPDVESAEAHSARHKETVLIIAALKKDLDQQRAYMDYLRKGGEVGNPFWEDDPGPIVTQANAHHLGITITYPSSPEG